MAIAEGMWFLGVGATVTLIKPNYWFPIIMAIGCIVFSFLR